MSGTGFPGGDAVEKAFNIGPGQDYPMTASPAHANAQGRFTFTFTVLDIFCGYDGQVNTYDSSGDGHLLTSSPLAVVC